MTERSMDELMELIGFLLDDFDKICRYAFETYRGYPPKVHLEHDRKCTLSTTASAP